MKKDGDAKKGTVKTAKTVAGNVNQAGNTGTAGGGSAPHDGSPSSTDKSGRAATRRSESTPTSPSTGVITEPVSSREAAAPKRSSAPAETGRKATDGQASGAARNETSHMAHTSMPRSLSRSTVNPRRPTYEEISRRAYEIFLNRGGAPGDPASDWYQAERELMAEGPIR